MSQTQNTALISASLPAEDFALTPQSTFLDTVNGYQQIMSYYEAGVNLLQTKIQILQREYQYRNDRNPIASVSSRIKSLESILGKLHRKEKALTGENILHHVHDVAGIRVVCPFITDVYFVANALTQQPDIHLIRQKDYITSPKSNGYRSLHLIIEIDVHFSELCHRIPIEIQIRTMAMDCWASIEHQMRYKKGNIFTSDMEKALKECAEKMADSDAIMGKTAASISDFFV